MMHPPHPETPATTEPSHRLGDYRAWALNLPETAPVDMIWVSKAHKTKPLDHLIMPHGEPSIAIRRRKDQRGALHDIDLIICGPFTKARWYCPEPGEELIAVRLKPEASVASFGILAGEYLDADPVAKVTAAESLGENALRVAEKCDMLEVAQTLLGDLLIHSHHPINHYTAEYAAADMLRRSDGQLKIRAIAAQLDISERHFRRRFFDATGMSPKTYARQLRVAATALRADAAPTPNWASIANDCGYFDQAHMIADFQSLCGKTPVETHHARAALRASSGSVFSNT